MKKIIAITAVLLLAILAVFVFHKKSQTPHSFVDTSVKSTASSTPQQQEDKPRLKSAINGVMVDPKIAEKRPLAVMVENHPDARPQSGLVNADMVYETLAEGGITRFMAIYQVSDSKNIGPVRSARTYFAEVADELGAVYAHAGGNSDVLAYIQQGVYKSIANADEFANGDYFHRITARYAPHNLYSSTDKLAQLVTARNFGTRASYQPWQFKNDGQLYASSGPAQSITIDFSLPQFLVNYKYDQSSNQYLRYLAGKPHTDLDTGKQIVAKDVIVQFVNTFPVKSDTPLSIGETLTGSGKADVFEDGKVIQGTWKKAADGRTRYYDPNGQEIQFNAGKIWVEIVPVDRTVSWK